MKPTSQLGMTLVEIMIVVIIMALIATGAAVAVLPALKRARVKQTQNDARAVRNAAVMYLADNPGRCPTPDQLVTEGFLERTARAADAWDNPFTIACDEQSGEPQVSSLGPDGQPSTQDDISTDRADRPQP